MAGMNEQTLVSSCNDDDCEPRVQEDMLYSSSHRPPARRHRDGGVTLAAPASNPSALVPALTILQ